MDEQSVGVRAGNVGKAAARGFVATALTLSLVPSLAYASPETEEETAPQATNSEAISPVSETSDGVSTQNYTYDLSKIADGTYSSTIDLKDIEGAVAAGEEEEWELYDLTVKVTVADHKISNVDVSATNPSASDKYVKWAKEGRSTKNVAGVPSQIVDKQSTTVDAVTGATYSSKAIATATDKALQAAFDEQNTKPVDPTPAEDEYTYGYAGLTWAEYWAAEGVYNADNTSTSDVKDSHNEYDKGGFDVVTRATTNHGLHRGSYQCIATIYGASGAKYGLATWSADGKSFTTTDGKTIQYNKGTMTLDNGTTDTVEHYEVSGLKYVPVKVKTSDLEAFKAKYAFVENGSTLAGGYSENKLQAYSVTAEVDADTNGLKTVTKSGDSFSFGKAATGTTSGIKDQALKTATGIETIVKEASGSYGEFLRVDLGGDYGDLGANMQSVTWTYYGDDSTYANAKRTFGTKFAADNWMHKSMNIQLGLTESARCELPEGTNGEGYWTLTVHALGYADYTVQFQATEDNIVGAKVPVTDETKAKLQALYDKASSLTKSSYTEDSWTKSSIETETSETKELLEKKNLGEAEAAEQITHLQAALDALVKVAPEAGDYILMNIPYSEFYATETANNSTPVDVFTSATKNKVRTGSLAGGSYHKDATGDEISGITYAVKVTEDAAKKIDWSKYTQITDDSSVDVTVTNRGKESTTTYKGKDALFEADTYSYYIIGSDEQANYKELTVDADGNLSFSAIKGAEAKTITGISAGLSTTSTYGDYELDLDESLKAAIKGDGESDATVYGVVVNTTDGTGYGMRHLENIWRTVELAWCTGFTEKVHNCPTSSEHYKSMMGKTISSVTYYTSTGVYNVDIDDVYVPIKTADSKLNVTAEADADEATVEATLPFQNAKYLLDDETHEVEVANGKLNISELEPGSYTLIAVDTDGNYAEVSADFTVSTANTVAKVENNKVVAANESIEEDDLDNYLGNITKVTVDGTSYSATGRGSVAIVNKDGSINTAVESNGKKVFDGYGEHSIVIESTGYTTNVEGTVTLEADKSALNDAIKEAQKILDSEEASTYTADTIKALNSAIDAGKKVVENKAATDEEVASATKALEDAISNKQISNKVKLNAAIESAKTYDGKEADYTKASWSKFATALAAAEKTAADASASEDDYATATKNLTDAQSGLAKVATESEKSALNTEIKKANDYAESDYTADSWAAYQKALENAKKVAADEDASEDDVVNATNALAKARQALTEPGAASTNNGSSAAAADTAASAGNSAKTGDDLGLLGGAFAAVAAAAAGAAAFARRKFMSK